MLPTRQFMIILMYLLNGITPTKQWETFQSFDMVFNAIQQIRNAAAIPTPYFKDVLIFSMALCFRHEQMKLLLLTSC